MARFSSGRRSDELWNGSCRCVPTGRHLRRKNSQGSQGRRSPRSAVGESSVCYQSQDRKNAWPDLPASVAWPRRRGDRMKRRIPPSLPDLIRQSILFRKKMDARVISAFTRIHSPSKTGVNALNDALLPAHDELRVSVLTMKRREFISLIGGGAAAAWPLAARAQQPAGKVWRVGILQPGAPPEPLIEATRQRLRQLGYVEGRNVAFEYRWAEGKLDRLTDLATELVGSKLDVITTQSTPAAL